MINKFWGNCLPYQNLSLESAQPIKLVLWDHHLFWAHLFGRRKGWTKHKLSTRSWNGVTYTDLSAGCVKKRSCETRADMDKYAPKPRISYWKGRQGWGRYAAKNKDERASKKSGERNVNSKLWSSWLQARGRFGLSSAKEFCETPLVSK